MRGETSKNALPGPVLSQMSSYSKSVPRGYCEASVFSHIEVYEGQRSRGNVEHLLGNQKRASMARRCMGGMRSL